MTNSGTLSASIDQLWDFGNPAESEARFRARLAEAIGMEALLLHTQVARSLGLQRRFDEADDVLDAVEEALPPGDSLARVRMLLERGRVRNSSGRKQESLPYFQEAYRMAQRLGEDFYTVDAAHMLGIAETGAASIEWNERALDTARKSGDERTRGWRGSLLNNLAWTYHDLGQFPRALALFEETVTIRQAQGKPEPLRIARWSVARCKRSLGRIDEALKEQQALAEELHQNGGSDGYVSEELGECLWALGRQEEARPHLRRAYVVLSEDPWLRENEAARLDRMSGLAAGASE